MTPVYEPQLINGQLWDAQSAMKPHSIQTNGKGVYKFEVYEGEAREGKDAGKERSELSQGEENAIGYGRTIWTAYSFRISSGSKWQNIVSVNGQFHAGAGSPNLSFRVNSYNNLMVYLRYGNSENFRQKVLFEDKYFKPGQWYNIVIKSVFSKTSTGLIEIWINGKKRVSYKGVTGYDDCNSTYFKFGIYRSTSAPDFERVYFANVETGIKDLSARINKPLLINS